MNPILSAIYKEDIYAGFNPLPEDLQGWGGADPIFVDLIAEKKPKVIIEVGSWKGMSAVTMGEACRAQGLKDTAIICVDTWLGSEEHILNCQSELKPDHGYPTLYRQFLSNVINRGLQEWIVPLPTTAASASVVFELLGVQADLIYIDANHQTAAALADMEAFWPRLAPGGVMFGHDISFASVMNAVTEFTTFRGLQISWSTRNDFWVIDPKK